MFRKVLVAVFLIATVVYGGTALAQELTPEERAALEAQYAELQKEIAEQQKIIAGTQEKKKSLQGDVTVLNAQIKAAQAQIDAKNIAIKQLAAQITKKTQVIGQLESRIERGKESLASLLRQTQMLDDYSVVSVALGSQNVSEFFNDLDAFAAIKSDLRDLFADIRATKAKTESEKADLAAKKDETADAKYEVEVKQKKIAGDKTQKQQLLAITANQETEYKKVLAERQAKAAAIRAALFPLRDATAIQFEEALALAKRAEARTGVRPAFLLAVLTQESNMGKNVGQCYLTNTATGGGVSRSSGRFFSNVMKPGRDIPPFLDLGLRLGFDPLRQVVSCPQSSGWGGAMGPAQFIPSTWASYETRTAAVSGHAVPNPWAAEDALVAMALYMGDLGAGAGGYSAEHRAAAKYYAGGAWATAGRGYANNVLALAEDIQNNIDFLSNN